jgi:hypothetical protein
MGPMICGPGTDGGVVSPTPCGPGNCAGCCNGNVCADGGADEACGIGGQSCQDCAAMREICFRAPLHDPPVAACGE